MTPELEKIGGLECIHKKGDGKTGAIIMLHGYGADAYDLYPLSDYFKVKDGFDWYFPNGILEIPIGPGFFGRAWFPISISEKIQNAVISGDWSKIADFVPPGLDEARDKINTFIDLLPIPYNKIILSGFSQGAMLSLEVFLHRKEDPHSLVLLSGTMLKEKEWRKLAKEKSGFQFFQSHGTEDVILPFKAAKRLEELLRDSGMSGEFVSFNGGHEIPESLIKRVNNYINR
ncbi:MAG: esterase [Leptospiraceae bacterium]|nr:esterase [Leptospiraceae bacterium]